MVHGEKWSEHIAISNPAVLGVPHVPQQLARVDLLVGGVEAERVIAQPTGKAVDHTPDPSQRHSGVAMQAQKAMSGRTIDPRGRVHHEHRADMIATIQRIQSIPRCRRRPGRGAP